MFVGKNLNIILEDDIKVNTSNSRQVVSLDLLCFRSRTAAFHNSLFILLQEFDDVSAKIASVCFVFLQIASVFVHFFIDCFSIVLISSLCIRCMYQLHQLNLLNDC